MSVKIKNAETEKDLDFFGIAHSSEDLIILEAECRVSPRKSFEKWREVVESTSYPWLSKELNILPELKSIVRSQTENQLRQMEVEAIQNTRILRDNEHRYLQLMELSPVGFFTVIHGRIIYCNSEAAQQLG